MGIQLLNSKYVGWVFFTIPEKRVAIVPAIKTTGIWWWKRSETGYAVVIIDVVANGNGGNYWKIVDFFKDIQEAIVFRDFIESGD